MKTIFAILFLCSAAVSQDAAVTQSSEQGWMCGACTDHSLSHRWASEVLEVYRKKLIADNERAMASYEKCVAEDAVARKKAKGGVLWTTCIRPYLPDKSWNSSFRLTIGDGQEYQIDICLDHGETRIRRLDYQKAQASTEPAATKATAAEKPVTVTGICEQNCKVGEASR
jgi:hypothetical protein